MKTFLTILVSGLVLSVAGLAVGPAQPLTNKEVKQLIATASTPADHMRLATYFQLKAEKLESGAKEHAGMALHYRAHPTASETKLPGSAPTAAHCEWLSQDMAKAANQARTLAGDQRTMAQQP